MRRKVKRDLSLTEKTQAWVVIRLAINILIPYQPLPIIHQLRLEHDMPKTLTCTNKGSDELEFPKKRMKQRNVKPLIRNAVREINAVGVNPVQVPLADKYPISGGFGGVHVHLVG